MGALKIGADPEFFLMQGGKPRSAHNMIPGTKNNPFPVPCGAVQVDGMALEFNIDPVEHEEDFVHNINTVLQSLRSMVPGEYEFAFDAAVRFDPDHMDEQPAEAKELGCEPDYCGWTDKVNPAPDAGVNLRTASGHVHLGWTEVENPLDPDHFYTCCDLAKQLDYALAVPMMLIEPANERRKLYGKAGCFRPKKYGMEYRTLSNYWLRSPDLMRAVFLNTRRAFEMFDKEENFYSRFRTGAQLVLGSNNMEGAERLVQGMGKDWRLDR